MSYRRVDIRIFDFHLSLVPILEADSVKPAVAFLTDPAKYNQQYGAKPLTAGAFRIRPLKKQDRTYHRFWQYYARSFSKFDPWSLVVPFLCEPVKFRLDISSPEKQIRAFTKPAVYLFPFGWSTTIEVSLHGKDMDAGTLRDFMGSLRTRSDGPFLIDGKPASLSAVFKTYGDAIKDACLTEGSAALDLRRVDRHFVVSLSQFDGEIRYYKPRHQGDPPMQAADKAALHEILLGEVVSPAEVVALDANADGKGRCLYTRFANAGFALTYFDVGTLLFVQNKAANRAQSDAMGCLTTNVMASMMLIQGLQSFYDFPETQEAKPDSLMAKTRDLARQRIVSLPNRYKNAVLSRWCKNYAPVQQIIAGKKGDQEKGGPTP